MSQLLDTCLFCKIIRGIIPCHKVLDTAKVLAFMDIGPLSEGHILVIPKHHGEFLHVIPEDILAEVLPAARKIALKAFAEDNIAYNILQNNGKLAHQEVGHVHFHIIPKRNASEGLGISWKSQSIPQGELAKYASELSSKLENN